ncbi:MAG: hypothetical protein M5U34_48690 [Chloroflexi bacterium]|nr:hypothetical protein [Chloroflexota bacterium]
MKKPQAFIIEDNAMLSTLFEEALREAGYETETALDGQVGRIALKGIHAPSNFARFAPAVCFRGADFEPDTDRTAP